MYTVKQLSNLAGVSVRTLHYYDEIDLLKPAQIAANGYRHYDDAALLRLQQILFYREIGLELLQIKVILDSPDFDLVAALRAHRAALHDKIDRLQDLITTVDDTIRHLAGEQIMSKKRMFEAFSPEQQKDYEREARLQYGPSLVNESVQRYNAYSAAEKQAIGEEGNQVYSDLVEALEAGIAPNSAEVQAILKRWHEHLRYFYEPNIDILRGLGQMYHDDERFAANFQKLHPDLPVYLRDGITLYVDDLETAAIVRMLEEDAANRASGG